MQYWSWALMAVGVFGLLLAGRLNRLGWAIGLGAQVLWFAYAIFTEQYGFIVSAFAYAWVYAKNFRAWRKEAVVAAQREVTIRLDLENEMVAAWYERLMESTRHPMYQNGIRLMKTVEVEE